MKHTVRNWHTWASVGLGVPLLLVGLTTFFIAHGKALGTRDVIVPAWLAGGAAANAEAPLIRSLIRKGEETWLGTNQGVFRLAGEQALPLDGGPKDEIRAMAVVGEAVLMAGKKGLWRFEGGSAKKAHAAAECFSVQADASGLRAACKDDGLLTSRDGKTWEAVPAQFPAGEAKSGVPLNRWLLDLHTGKFFFGKQYEWIWMDVLGLATVGLGLTGLVMWMRGRRQRAAVGAA